jgi:CheY-like chemotaxis protein
MCKVIVVDDDPIYHYIAEYLSRSIVEIKSFKCFIKPVDALKFLSTIKKNRQLLPDLILLDMDMPEMDGLQFLMTFKSIYSRHLKEISVYLISSSVNSYQKAVFNEFDFVKGIFSKPLTKEIFLDVVLNASTKKLISC